MGGLSINYVDEDLTIQKKCLKFITLFMNNPILIIDRLQLTD